MLKFCGPQLLAFGCLTMFHKTCLNRLARTSNSKMFDHQTMFGRQTFPVPPGFNSPHDSELRLTWSTLSFGDWKINMAERWREKTQILWTWKALHFIAVQQHFQYSKFLKNRRWWWIIKKSLQRRRKGPRSAKRKRDVWRVTVSFNCQLIYVISEQF